MKHTKVDGPKQYRTEAESITKLNDIPSWVAAGSVPGLCWRIAAFDGALCDKLARLEIDVGSRSDPVIGALIAERSEQRQ